MKEIHFKLLEYYAGLDGPNEMHNVPGEIWAEIGIDGDLMPHYLLLKLQGYLVNYDATLYQILPKGLQAYHDEKERRKQNEEDKILEREKRKYDTAIARWMRKTYWWTFAIAVIGATTGIASLIITLLKN